MQQGTSFMINQIRIYRSTLSDPYWNLAAEKRLMDTTGDNECTLYLWQNQNTVVIGQNQNAWVECRTTLLEKEGGKLARRLSGGGAVFHDLGNLNFTFLVKRENYDLDKQLSVIEKACSLAGIQVERSGRNDLLAEGRKFSGNAFYNNKTHAYHHGTLLVDADMDKLSRYLSPSKAKLESKGVASVRSRVVNLQELAPELTVSRMADLMESAFEAVYGYKAMETTLDQADLAAITQLQQQYSSWDYLYGTSLPFSFTCESRYPWGSIQLQLSTRQGIIDDAKVYSDSMDWALPETIRQALTGCRFTLEDMQAAIRNAVDDREAANDLCVLLSKQQI